MYVLVTGANGMLGRDLCNLLRADGHRVVEWDLPEHDVTDVTPTVSGIVKVRPQAVVHLAAFTDVDAAETRRPEAYKTNTMGAWAVAIGSRDAGAEMVYLSTDYVFDGRKRAPYLENDPTGPLNYYGATKLLGEQAVARDVRRHYICRTSWLFGRHGRNFVDTIIRKAREQNTVRVVNDQQGCPTWTQDLARALVRLLGSKQYGTYHISNSGVCSWFDFAQEIVRQAGLAVRIEPMDSAELGRPAPRPEWSVLDTDLFQSRFKYGLRSWSEALNDYLGERRLLARTSNV